MLIKTKKLHNSAPCLAPFNSLFFSMTGKAYFCLANKQATPGSYPRQTVDEIISGAFVRSLRNRFSDESFIEGCEKCRYHLDHGTSGNAFLNFHKAYPLRKDFLPRYIDFELDNRCNLHCAMCSPYFSSSAPYSDGSYSNYKTPYDEAFYASFDRYAPYLIKAHFRGGEPFLVSRYHDFWERLLTINPSLRIGVTTNGTVLSERHKAMLEKGNFDVNISLDSLEAATYAGIRLGAQFEQYREHLDYLVSLHVGGRCNLSACMCLMKLNWPEFPALFRFCNQHGIVVYINFVEEPEFLSLKSYNRSEIALVIDHLKKTEISWSSPAGAVNQVVFSAMLLRLSQWEQSAPTTVPAQHEVLAAVPGNKELFLRNLAQFIDENPEFSSYNSGFFASKFDAMKPFEKGGFPIDLVYSSLVKGSLRDILEKLQCISTEELNRKILDKYFLAVNTLTHHENEALSVKNL